MRRLLIATTIFPPDIGGPATYFSYLATSLADFGYEVNVLTYGAKEKAVQEKKTGAFKVKRVSRKIPFLLRQKVYFLKLLFLAQKSDVIYSQGSISASLPAILAAKILGKRAVLRITGDLAFERAKDKRGFSDNLLAFQKKEYGLRIELLRFLDHLAAKKVSRIILPSFYLRETIEAWGVEREKISVIHNGIKIIQEEISKSSAKEKIGLEGEIILSAGRLIPLKGFDCLIEVLLDLLKINPSFKLVIMGEGPQKQRYEAMIANFELEGKVVLTGKINQEQTKLYYSAADIFVLNSLHDTFPYVILEAMAFGLPIAASGVGGIPEIIENNETGLLFKADDHTQIKEAILKIHKNDVLREKIIQKAKEKLKLFDYDKMIEETRKVIFSE